MARCHHRLHLGRSSASRLPRFLSLRHRRRRVPFSSCPRTLTATLISLAMASTTLFGTPAAGGRRRSPHGTRRPQPRQPGGAEGAKGRAPIPSRCWSSPRPPASGTTPSPPASPPSSSSAPPNSFTVDATEDAAAFTDANLAQYEAVIWLSTTGDVLNADQQAAFERYIAGRRRLRRRARRLRHRVRLALVRRPGRRVLRQPPGEPAGHRQGGGPRPTRRPPDLPDRWTRTDEWYNYRTNPRGNVHVLASLDETQLHRARRMGADHPISWCQDYDGGRSWYTGAGPHRGVVRRARSCSHLLGGIQTAAGVGRRPTAAARRPAASRRSRWTATPATRWSWTSPRTGGSSTSSATARADRQADHRQHRHRRRPGRLHRQRGRPARHGARPGLRHQPLDVPLLLADERRHRVNRLSRFTRHRRHHRPGQREVRSCDVDTQRSTVLPRRRRHGLRRDGNLYLATGDNTNPFDSDGYAPIDERPGRSRLRRPAHRRQHQRPARQGAADPPGGRRHATPIPAGNLFAPGTAKTRPEIYAMGFRNPFRIGIDTATGIALRRRLRAGRRRRQPEPRPGGQVELNVVTAPGNYGWPYCTGNEHAVQRLQLRRPARRGAKFNCAGAGQQLARTTPA